MPDLRKLLGRLAAHASGRRIRGYQLGMLTLQVLEPPHELVELEIRDLRIIQHIVAVLVVTDLVAELLDFAFNAAVHGSLH